jgi:hypothetical protein
MTPRLFINAGILPAYSLLPERMASRNATAMIIAICLQESRFKFRRQIERYSQGHPIAGAAKGYAQFEMSGGILGVLRHEETREPIRVVLKALDYDDDVLTSYTAIEHNDVLCAAYARLLLWSDPAPLPEYGQNETAWLYYLRTWRPGKPIRSTWDAFYDLAWGVVQR